MATVILVILVISAWKAAETQNNRFIDQQHDSVNKVINNLKAKGRL